MTDHTTYYAWEKPTIGASSDAWGGILNATIDGIDTSLHGVDLRVTSVTDAMRPSLVPMGFIGMWSGSAASIPAGWHLCDGTSGTPDLRDRFIVGAGGAYAPAATGGSTSQTPSVTVATHALALSEIPSHDHGFVDNGHSHAASGADHSHGIAWSYGQYLANIGPGFGVAGLVGGNSVTALGTPNATDGSGATGVSVSGSGSNISFGAQGSGAAHGHPGSTVSAIDVRPPYYALCFIMKIV
jgi:hypothetical protein